MLSVFLSDPDVLWHVINKRAKNINLTTGQGKTWLTYNFILFDLLFEKIYLFD